ncbi:MAG: SPOR domain-containing protein [Polyangiaceae bacterium]
MRADGMRDLERIQEDEADARNPRGIAMAFAGATLACALFGFLAFSGKKSQSQPAKQDPLAELVSARMSANAAMPGAQGSAAPGPKPSDLSAKDVTFPGTLSDSDNPTTALAAMRPGPQLAMAAPIAQGAGPTTTAAAPVGVQIPAGMTNNGQPLDISGPPGVAPPAAGDRLPVVPLPAQNVLQATSVITRPRDALTKSAVERSEQATNAQAPAPAGKEGGYQLQVSSFRTQKEASQFADNLRARGHKAYVQQADVPGRGTWFRVRVGPFATQHAAMSYRSTFEGKEHVVPFVVPPNK